MSRPVRLALLAVAVVAASVVTIVLLTGDDEEAEPAWVTCEAPLVGEERRTEVEAPLPDVAVERFVALEAPTDLATRAGDDAVYVAERAGTIWRVTADGEAEAVLEVDTTLEKERGLLSVTFDPEGTHLYVNHTDPDGTNQVVAHPVGPDGVPGEGVAILALEQQRANHNLDELVFGPDGALYLSVGDGGVDEVAEGAYEEGDPDRAAQDLADLHGKILRITPDPEAGGYTVPTDNPFADDAEAAPEVWMSGLRNPWRFSFDAEAGEVWIGDVGQYCFEEIDRIALADAPGANLGWSGYEGFQVHHEDRRPDDHVLPIHTYARDAGDGERPPQCAVVGGHVYRGAALPDLEGAYLFADFCSCEVRVLRTASHGGVDVDVLVDGLVGIQSLAEDVDGELWVLAADGAYRLIPGDEVPGNEAADAAGDDAATTG